MNTLASGWGLLAIILVCVATVAVGALGLRMSRTTSDFYVAGRVVTAGWNASAIGGEYLSAASFLGVAGIVYSLGTHMLWLPVGYTLGYLILLVLVAAPLRRSGAYTIPDFAEARLSSRRVRRIASVLVVGIGWLYLLPQFQGAGLALQTVTGASPAVGSLIVAVVVLVSVAAGGMRSITLVQAMQYWLKLAAISIPCFVLAWLWFRGGQPLPSLTDPGGPFAGALPAYPMREHPLYATYSTLLALCFGTMGLPHVLVRFYTNPDGPAARRTTVIVIALLGAFYLFPPVLGMLGRVYLPSLPAGTRADSVVLLLPSAVTPGTLGDLLSAILAGGAFAAFLSTASGLTVSVAGVIDQDLLSGAMNRRLGGDLPRTHSFRLASLVGSRGAPRRHRGHGLRDRGLHPRPPAHPRRVVAPVVGHRRGGRADRRRNPGDGRHRGDPLRRRPWNGWVDTGAARPTGRVVDADRLHDGGSRVPGDPSFGARQRRSRDGPPARPRRSDRPGAASGGLSSQPLGGCPRPLGERGPHRARDV